MARPAWTAESGSYTPSDETITQAALSAYKSTSKLIASEELRVDSAVDLDRFLAQELGTRLGVLQEAAYVSGDGSGKPTGILNAASSVTVVTAPNGNTTSLTPAALSGALKALPAVYRASAAWVMHPDLFANLAATDFFTGLQFSPPSAFGLPVYLSANLAAPAASAKSAIVGDFKLGYGIRRVNGVSIQRQDEIHSDSGQVGYRCFQRVDGKVLLADALRVVAHSAT